MLTRNIGSLKTAGNGLGHKSSTHWLGLGIVLSLAWSLAACNAATATPTPPIATTVPPATSTPAQTPTETSTAAPTPTATSIYDYSEAFTDDPQTVNDPNALVAPGLTDPTRAQWIAGYLAAVDAKLAAGYPGPFIGSDRQMVYDKNKKTMNFASTTWKPIASYKYQWVASDGSIKWIVVKTYAVVDTVSGQKSSFSVAYTPESDLHTSGKSEDLSTPTKPMQLRLWYANDFIPSGDSFSKAFLPADNGAVDPLGVFFNGQGITPELQTEPLVFSGFY
jgi:hypothetical protein